MNYYVTEKIRRRIDALDIPFNHYGMDRYGVSKEHLGALFTMLDFFYEKYFTVETFGVDNIPDKGRGLLIGNHSGGIPFDGGMVLHSLIVDKEPPRLAHGMVEKFAQRWPFISFYFNRFGQFTGLPEHARRLLREERLVLAFPEGVRGIGKLYEERYSLVRFGTGFMRLALQSDAPIIPFAFIGGEESFPVMIRLEKLGKMLGAPFIPIPTHIIPLPKPMPCQIFYGEPMYFEGDGSESDEVIHQYVDQVSEKISELIEEGRAHRRKHFAELGES